MVFVGDVSEGATARVSGAGTVAGAAFLAPAVGVDEPACSFDAAGKLSFATAVSLTARSVFDVFDVCSTLAAVSAGGGLLDEHAAANAVKAKIPRCLMYSFCSELAAALDLHFRSTVVCREQEANQTDE